MLKLTCICDIANSLCVITLLTVCVLPLHWQSVYYHFTDSLCIATSLTVCVLPLHWQSVYCHFTDSLCIAISLTVCVLPFHWQSVYCHFTDNLCIMALTMACVSWPGWHGLYLSLTGQWGPDSVLDRAPVLRAGPVSPALWRPVPGAPTDRVHLCQSAGVSRRRTEATRLCGADRVQTGYTFRTNQWKCR